MQTAIGVGIGLHLLPSSAAGGDILDSMFDSSNSAWWVAAVRDGGGDLVDGTGGGRDMNLPGGSNNPTLLDHDGTNYFYMPAQSGNTLTVPDAAYLDTTDLDVRAKVRPNTWLPGSRTGLAQRWGGTVASWLWDIRGPSSTRMGVYWYETGGTLRGPITASADIPFTDGDDGWVRLTIDVDNGSGGHDVKFWTSTDGTSWTQLGTTQNAGAFTTSLRAGDSDLEIGVSPGGYIQGRLYQFGMYDAIDGTAVADVNVTDADPDTSTFTEASSNAATVTIGRGTAGLRCEVVDAPAYTGTTDDYMRTSDQTFGWAADEAATFVIVTRSHPEASKTPIGCHFKDNSDKCNIYHQASDTSSCQNLLRAGAANTYTATTNVTAQTLLGVGFRRAASGGAEGLMVDGETLTKTATTADPGALADGYLELFRMDASDYANGGIREGAFWINEYLTDDQVVEAVQAIITRNRAT